MNEREAREAALQRRGGATGEALAAMRAADEAATWHGCCGKCGEAVTGQLLTTVHKCG